MSSNNELINTANELVKKPNNILLSEINAISLTKLNATKEAIDAYEKLFLLTKKNTLIGLFFGWHPNHTNHPKILLFNFYTICCS